MYLVSLDIDGREGTGRTQVFAGATAYAAGFVDCGNVGRLLVIRVRGYHLDGTDRAMAGTVATLYTVGQRDTVLLNPYGMAHLRRGLVFRLDR